MEGFPVDVRAATEAPAASTASFQCVDSVVHPKAHSPTRSRIRPHDILSLSSAILSPLRSPSVPPCRTSDHGLSIFVSFPRPIPLSSSLSHSHFSVVVAIRRASAGCARGSFRVLKLNRRGAAGRGDWLALKLRDWLNLFYVSISISPARDGGEHRKRKKKTLRVNAMYIYMLRNASFHSREIKPCNLRLPLLAINRIFELERAILFVSRTIRCVWCEGDGWSRLSGRNYRMGRSLI